MDGLEEVQANQEADSRAVRVAVVSTRSQIASILRSLESQISICQGLLVTNSAAAKPLTHEH
jgi:hypothetical protein